MKKQTKKPLVSIVLPVYNAEKYLAEAIDSVLKQTYRKWELIIVDDGSTDSSAQIAQKFAKRSKRIHFFQNKTNRGVAFTANKAIKKAQGQFIARMDADDIMYHRRLEKQVVFLQENPQVVLVGTQCNLIDAQGKFMGEKLFPTDFSEIKKQAFINLPIQQPSMMVNTALLPKSFKWYRVTTLSAEEHELFFKLLQYGEIANLPQKLHKYRFHGENLSLQRPKLDFFKIFWARLKGVWKYGYTPDFLSVMINLAQLAVMLILPSKLIFPVFFYLRDLMTNSRKRIASYLLAIQ